MNYKLVTWPDIQDYMIKYPDYKEKTFFDADKNVWLVPEEWVIKNNTVDKLLKDRDKINESVSNGINNLIELVNANGGIIITNPHNNPNSPIYGFLYNWDENRINEVSILALFTHEDDLFIEIAYSDNVYVDDDYEPNIDDDKVYCIVNSEISTIPTMYNILEYITEYI